MTRPRDKFHTKVTGWALQPRLLTQASALLPLPFTALPHLPPSLPNFLSGAGPISWSFQIPSQEISHLLSHSEVLASNGGPNSTKQGRNILITLSYQSFLKNLDVQVVPKSKMFQNLKLFEQWHDPTSGKCHTWLHVIGCSQMQSKICFMHKII